MGTIVKLTIAMLLLSFCCFAQQSSRRKLIAPRPASGDVITDPPTNGTALIWWSDVYRGLTNTSDVFPSDGDTVKDWSVIAGLDYGGTLFYWYTGYGTPYPKYYATGGPTNGPRLFFGSGANSRGVEKPSYAQYAQPFYLFFVCRFDATAVANCGLWCGYYLPSTLRYLYASDTGGKNYLRADSGTELAGPATIGSNEWVQVTAIFNGNNSSLRVNGTNYATGNAGTGNINGDTFIANLPTGSPLNGDIAETLCYTNISMTVVTNIERYLTNKHKIAP